MSTSILVNLLFQGGPQDDGQSLEKGYAFPRLSQPLPLQITRSYCEQGLWHCHKYNLDLDYLHVVPVDSQVIPYLFDGVDVVMTEVEYHRRNEKWDRKCEPWPQ